MTISVAAAAAPDLLPPDVGTFCPGTNNTVVHKFGLDTATAAGVSFTCPCGTALTTEQALSMTR